MDKLHEKIYSLRVNMLYSSLKEVTIAVVALPLLTYFSIGTENVKYWLSAYLVVGALVLSRSWHYQLTLSSEKEKKDLVDYVSNWKKQSYAFAIFWSILPWLADATNPNDIIIIGFAIAGVTAGTTLSCAPFPKISFRYSSAVLLSFVMSLFSNEHFNLFGIALMVSLYFVLLLKMQKNLEKFVNNSFYLMNDLDEANEKIQRSHSAALVSSRLAAQAEMTASLAHEINNPLAVIYFKIEHLQRCLEKGKLTDAVVGESCKKSILMMERIQEIISSTKKYFYNDGENRDLVIVDCEKVAAEVSSVFSEKCRSRNIDFQLTGISDIQVLGVETSILQVITNLLNNAFDAVKDMENGGAISLHGFVEEDYYLIKVSDSGGGIPEAKQRKIFEPFFTTKGKGAGLGIGLSICLALVKQMDGELWLDKSIPTTFSLKLLRAKTFSQAI